MTIRLFRFFIEHIEGILVLQGLTIAFLTAVIQARSWRSQRSSGQRVRSEAPISLEEAHRFLRETPKDEFLETAKHEIEAFLEDESPATRRNPYLGYFLQAEENQSKKSKRSSAA